MNQPFGDPVLYVRLMGEKKALLFDLGELNSLNAGKLFKITHVFVSHTHMDHFIGFDHLVRMNLARDKTIHIYGPEGIIRNVSGKLKGYTWNLVKDYPFIIEVIEISPKKLRKVLFFCREKFKAGQIVTAPFEGMIDINPHYTVNALRVDHKITSIIFTLKERFHININKDRLKRLELPVGKWLRELKEYIWEGKTDSWPVRVTEDRPAGGFSKDISLGELKKEIVTITKGQKIAYVSDCGGMEKNFRKIIPFVSGSDIMFCEAAFLEKDKERAGLRGHLTARQAGYIAREAGVKTLNVFHFSPRYEHCPGLLYHEADNEFLLSSRGSSEKDK
jgi:ribonuclease Z